jgi:hypothetical protein
VRNDGKTGITFATFDAIGNEGKVERSIVYSRSRIASALPIAGKIPTVVENRFGGFCMQACANWSKQARETVR